MPIDKQGLDELIARLQERTSKRVGFVDYRTVMVPCLPDHPDAEDCLINPDGPEAADTLSRYRDALDGCRAYFEALEEAGDRYPAMLKIIADALGATTKDREGRVMPIDKDICSRITDDVEPAIVNYIKSRGGHDTQCSRWHCGGCNCRAAEWKDAFFAGFRAALLASNRTEVERLRTLLEPFARVAERFGAIEGGVVEICRPHPNNPSSNIMPFGIEHFNRARTALESPTEGGGE